jgi:cysteine-rich repeat protein
MKPVSRSVALSLLLSIAWASSAQAVVESADDVCSPVANPCIVNSTVEVDADFPLDFGLRTVRVVEPGKFVGSLELTCGRFETVGLPTWQWMQNTEDSVSTTITANRSCSLNSAIPCQSDTVCTDAGAGLCTGGNGGIATQGKLVGNSPTVMLRAAGDIDLEGDLDVSSDPPAEQGGTVYIESKFGAVESSGFLDASGGISESYYGTGPAFGGMVTIRALSDVTVRGKIAATGGYARIEIAGGRDTIIAAGILTQGRQGGDYTGGIIDLFAGRNLSVIREAGLVRPVLDISGGSKEVQGYYGYGGGSYAGAGGYAFLSAGGDVTVGDGIQLMGDSGMSIGIVDDLPISGDWYFDAGSDLGFHATLSNRSWGQYGFPNYGVSLSGEESVHVGRRGSIATAGSYAGDITVWGPKVLVEGKLNARGRKIKTFGYYGYNPPPHGTGGGVVLGGGDVTLKGKVMTGGPTAAGELRVDACRLRMERGGSMDSAWGAQLEGPYGVSITVAESMTMNGGKIRAKEGATNVIRYRDANKPPILLGSITPQATLAVDPLMSGCPVCGNSEIDQDETCDDGNVANGDGCSSECLLEP